MSRQALTGIGQAIKANTTEKSIDQLRAEGKSKVRVVSSERVMAIIQAIVDDTISSEVGEITQRDRDRIVHDTKERFSHVLKMQQDSEEAIAELRAALNTAELERDRFKNDKSLLEAQLDSARKDDGKGSDLERVSRDVARVKDTVDRIAQSAAKGVDEVALGRLAEKLAAQDAQAARRFSTELDDLRERVGHLVRDVSASRDAAIEESFQRSRELIAETEGPVQARMDRELRVLAEHLTAIREKVGHAPAAEEAVTRLRGSLEAIEKRLQSVERSATEVGARVAEAVVARIEERESKAAANRSEIASAQTAALGEALRRLHHSSDEGFKNVVTELGATREATEDARTHSLSVRAEQFRDLERRISAGSADSSAIVAKTADQLAARSASLDATLQGLRRDFTALAERISAQTSAPPPVVTEALEQMREHASTTAAQTAEVHADISTKLEQTTAELRREIVALNARGTESAERQHEAVRVLGDIIAKSSTAQSDSLQTTFNQALERALDKIERTMQAATARPIEMTGEATEVLLSKIFDDPSNELTSNYDQLDVQQRKSTGSIAKSVGRLKEMGGSKTNSKEQPA